MHPDVLEDARAREALDREPVQAARIAQLASVTQLGIRTDGSVARGLLGLP